MSITPLKACLNWSFLLFILGLFLLLISRSLRRLREHVPHFLAADSLLAELFEGFRDAFYSARFSDSGLPFHLLYSYSINLTSNPKLPT